MAAQQFDVIDVLKRKVDALQRKIERLSEDELAENDGLSSIEQSLHEKPRITSFCFFLTFPLSMDNMSNISTKNSRDSQK